MIGSIFSLKELHFSENFYTFLKVYLKSKSIFLNNAPENDGRKSSFYYNDIIFSEYYWIKLIYFSIHLFF